MIKLVSYEVGIDLKGRRICSIEMILSSVNRREFCEFFQFLVFVVRFPVLGAPSSSLCRHVGNLAPIWRATLKNVAARHLRSL